MPSRIEDYALIGDAQTAGLVDRTGSIDWLCLPRFDSGACFAALLGDERNGRWRIAPAGSVRRVRRAYRGETLVLETEFETDDGVVRLVDCMSPRERDPDVVRVVEGVSGRVTVDFELVVRFDYGRTVPGARRVDGGLAFVAGPNGLVLRSPVELHGEGLATRGRFRVTAGQRVPFVLTWFPSHEAPPEAVDPFADVSDTERWWGEWASGCRYRGEWRDAVVRSLVTLKALTYQPTGGIVAAPTTSLPEAIGGVRNWDYRFCWLRDATLTLYSLIVAGFDDEAAAWRDWLLRAIAGDASQLQVMYGPAGERMLPEIELGWLGGYESSRPVRIGNAAVDQLQLDVYGEVLDMLHQARTNGIAGDGQAWDLQTELLDFLEGNWDQPDQGIWEVRGPRQHFTHSKVMAWVAFDRAVRAVEDFGLEGPADRWRRLRQDVHDDVCEKAYDADRGTFTQYYGSRELDAALLLMPSVGFLPATDPRVAGTIAAVERELVCGGFVQRYTQSGVDGLPPVEGAFLACTFWLADAYALTGRVDDARATYERLLALRNDVGLLSEEYDPERKRLVGNFPQAFSHVGLVNTARNLTRGGGPAARRPCDHAEHDHPLVDDG